MTVFERPIFSAELANWLFVHQPCVSETLSCPNLAYLSSLRVIFGHVPIGITWKVHSIGPCQLYGLHGRMARRFTVLLWLKMWRMRSPR